MTPPLTKQFDEHSDRLSVEGAYDHAEKAYNDGEYQESRGYLGDILCTDPSDKRALTLLVKVSHDNNPALSLRTKAYDLLKGFRDTGDSQRLLEAMNIADLAIEHDRERENDRNYYLKAATYRELGHPAESIRHLKLALEHNPEHEQSQKLMIRMENALTGENETARHCKSATLPYKPSPAGSEAAEFAATINAMNPWMPK